MAVTARDKPLDEHELLIGDVARLGRHAVSWSRSDYPGTGQSESLTESSKARRSPSECLGICQSNTERQGPKRSLRAASLSSNLLKRNGAQGRSRTTDTRIFRG
jgi:hypothetical protein